MYISSREKKNIWCATLSPIALGSHIQSIPPIPFGGVSCVRAPYLDLSFNYVDTAVVRNLWVIKKRVPKSPNLLQSLKLWTNEGANDGMREHKNERTNYTKTSNHYMMIIRMQNEVECLALRDVFTQKKFITNYKR